MSEKHVSIIIHFYYLCSTDNATSVREAGISFILPCSAVNWHSDLKAQCSNVTMDKQFYL
jgi:hypothetical protein